MLQFINLNGKIINTNSVKADISTDNSHSYDRFYASGELKSPIQVKNISQKGFACFFGDGSGINLLVFNTKGELSWQKKLNIKAEDFYMLTSGSNIYLLSKKNHDEWDCDLAGYSSTDINAETHLPLKDNQGNQLKVLKFDNDIVTGKPYLAGYIIDPKKKYNYTTGRSFSKGPYMGLFTINVNENTPEEVKKDFTYWSDGSTPGVSARGFFAETHSYAMFTDAFRDFNGNTYFTGPQLIRKTRWGSIASSIITLPLVIPPMWILVGLGTSKCKTTDAMLVKQDNKGSLSVENSIPADHSSYYKAADPLVVYNIKDFYTVFNSDTKTNYLIIDDEKNIFIYNVSKKQVARTIPHKDGNIKTYVYPAKEGYMMVSEYNKKEKYTRVSIVAL